MEVQEESSRCGVEGMTNRYSGMYIVPKGVSGVYALKHSLGKIYIGSSYRCIYNRLKWHFVKLRRNDHVTVALQLLWNESKPEDFQQILLEECLGKDICRDRELYWKIIYEKDLLNSSLSDAAKRRWERPEYRRAVSEAARADALERHRTDGGIFSLEELTGLKSSRQIDRERNAERKDRVENDIIRTQ